VAGASLVKRPIVIGIILGLGFGFMSEGAKMMSHNWWIGGAVLLVTILFLRSAGGVRGDGCTGDQ